MVVGHSMGAMIALDMAIRHPEKVQGVVALNAIFRRRPDAAEAVQARAASLDGVSMADPSGTLERWFGTDGSPEREACHTWLTEVNPAGYKAAYTIFAHQDGPDADDLTDLNCPRPCSSPERTSRTRPPPCRRPWPRWPHMVARRSSRVPRT